MSNARVQASWDDYGKLAELICTGAEVIRRVLSTFCKILEEIKGNRETKMVSCAPPVSKIGIWARLKTEAKGAIFIAAIEKESDISNIALVSQLKSAIDWGKSNTLPIFPRVTQTQ